MSQSPVPSNMNMMNMNDFQGQQPNMKEMKHRQKVASVSSIAHDEVYGGQYPMSLPPENNNINHMNQINEQYPMSMPQQNNNNLSSPKLPKRIDTMDNVFIDKHDLPPSLAPEDKAVLEAGNDDDNFKFGGPGSPGGEKTFMELDPRDPS